MTRALEDAELLPLLDALADADWHSGEGLAAAAGISRAALAKRIDRLLDWQLEIEARAGLGYRLAQPLQRLDAAVIRAGLSASAQMLLNTVAVALRVDSTNQRLLDSGAAQDPQALFAEAQTAGRGRRGRAWRSPFGANLYLSLGWSFKIWPPQLGTLPLVVGVACARALAKIGIANVGLKWPNDLRIGNAKLGGILIEQRGEFGGACRVVAGVGINFAMSAAQAGVIEQEWTTVQAALGGITCSRNMLAVALLNELLLALTAFEQRGFSPFRGEWSALDLSAGREVRIEGPGQTLIGRACGIDESGALIVDVAGQRHFVHAGEVSLRLPADAAQR